METQYLNRAQKRAHAIKDELHQLDSDHLDTFIDGIANFEPPKYRRVGANIVPDLVMVDLKKGAEIYNIGNVYYHHANEIKNVSLHIELPTRKFKIVRSERLPNDERNFLATPIHQFVAQEFVSLWKAKYQRIVEHRDLINETRKYAHHLLSQPPRRSVNGKAPGTQMGGYSKLDDSVDNAKSRKRLSGEPVVPHPSNKRARVGLLAMSDTTKCEMFAKIEDKFKVELFDAMIKAAFPGFDNVMTAAWNVVSVYAVVGSEFEALHVAVTELKAVLEEFDAAQSDESPKTAMRAEEKRGHSVINYRNGRKSATSTPEEPMEGLVGEGHPTQGLLPSQDTVIQESTRPEGMSKEAQRVPRPVIRNDEEISDDEARKEKFAEIKRRIEAKPRYTPTPHYTPAPMSQEENNPTRSDIIAENEEEMTNKHIQQLYDWDEAPQQAGRAEVNFNDTIPENIAESFEHNNSVLRLKQEEREPSEFRRMNEHERQFQPQQRPPNQPQENLQVKQNGRRECDGTKPAREDTRDSRDSREFREKVSERYFPTDVYQRSFNHDQAFDQPHARQQETRKPHPSAEKPKTTPEVSLGTSMLGAKKGTLTANGAASFAPMIHTLQNGSQFMSQYDPQYGPQHIPPHTIREDPNSTERLRQQ